MSSNFVQLPLSGGAETLALELGDKYVITTRFALIGAGTSGNTPPPTNSTIILDDFGGTIDAVISAVASSKPTFQPAKDASDLTIATSFNTDGDWVLTGTPGSYPVAIIYRVKTKLTDFDASDADIIGPATIEDPGINIQIFATSGTWYKPSYKTPKLVEVGLLSAGGGGGSGRKGLLGNGAAKCGGGGGAGGAIVFGRFSPAMLASSETVTIGAGGTGGLAQTTNSTNGNDGVDGGDTTFGSWLKAPGGPRGRGGTATTGTGGTAALGQASPLNFVAIAGASASTTGLAGSAPSASLWASPAGGASGGGISSADASSNGSIGGNLTSAIFPTISLFGGAAGGAAPANASDGSSANFIFGLQVGSGGGSSRSSITTSCGRGGHGGRGAGGGGGGASLDSTGDSGAGGNGGDGWAYVITYF